MAVIPHWNYWKYGGDELRYFTRKRNSPKIIRTLGTRPQKYSTSLPHAEKV